MHIPPSSAATAAAGTISQAASKDRSAAGQLDAAHVMASAQVERVARGEAASADRDAQGGGQGLGPHGGQSATDQPNATSRSAVDDMPVLDPEPPGELDIVG